MEKYECCICKATVTSESKSSFLDSCALILVSNIEQPRDNQKEQQFFCHFEYFRKLVNNDGIMYIMESDAATIGEIERDQENWTEDEGRAYKRLQRTGISAPLIDSLRLAQLFPGR